MIGGAFDDRTGPDVVQEFGGTFILGCNAFGFGVEEDDAAETGLFQSVGINVHFGKEFEEGVLDVQGGERFVGEWFEPPFHAL